MKSIIKSRKTREDVENEATVVRHWRSCPTVSHQVIEPVDWSTPGAVAVVSVAEHTNQESVCTALLLTKLFEEFLPLDGSRPRTRTR